MPKVIGKIVNVTNVSLSEDIIIVGVDGIERIALIGDFLYEGERIVNTNPESSIEIKYLAFSTPTIYENVFDIILNSSVYQVLDIQDSEVNIETAAGEESSETHSGPIPENSLDFKTSLQNLIDTDSGRASVNFTSIGLENRLESNSIDQNAPVILSDNVIVYDENATDVVLQMKVDDVNPFTYTLNAGLDSALFTISTTGAISFINPPDYEIPLDIGGDNEYNFTVTVTDSVGNSTTETISVNINNVNEALTAFDDGAGSTNEDTVIVIQASTLLANDEDIDGDVLTILSVENPVNGTVSLVGEVITFTPTPGYDGSASFSYTVSDGNGFIDTATVNLNVNSVVEIDSVREIQMPIEGIVFFYDDLASGVDNSGNGHTLTQTALNSGIYTTDVAEDINDGVFTQKTITTSFTTAVVNDDNTFQVIYEQGGGSNGYSISLVGDNAYAFVWAESYNTIEPDYKIIDLGVLESNTRYDIAMVHDSTAPNGGSLSGYLNHTLVDTLSGVGQMGAHIGAVGIGGVADNSVNPLIPTGLVNTASTFTGEIHSLASWNNALTSTQLIDATNVINSTTDNIVTVLETVDVGTKLLDIDASDTDGIVTYSLEDDFGGLFAVNADGEVSVNGILDYDNGITAYDLIIHASDNQGSTEDTNLRVVLQDVMNEVVTSIEEDNVLVGTKDYTTSKYTFPVSAGISNDGNNSITTIYEQRTVNLWFNADSIAGTQYLYGEGGGTRAIQIYMTNGVLHAQGYNKVLSENGWMTETILDAPVSSAVSVGTWHNVTITLHGDPANPQTELAADGFKLYLDGVLLDTGIGGAIYEHNQADVGSDYNGNRVFDGAIDNVRIFNKVLTPEDVSTIFSEDIYSLDPTASVAIDGSNNTNLTINDTDAGRFDIKSLLDSVDGEAGNNSLDSIELTGRTELTLSLEDVISLTDEDNTLVITSTDDANDIIHLDASFVQGATVGNLTTYTATDLSAGTVMITIEDTITVD